MAADERRLLTECLRPSSGNPLGRQVGPSTQLVAEALDRAIRNLQVCHCYRSRRHQTRKGLLGNTQTKSASDDSKDDAAVYTVFFPYSIRVDPSGDKFEYLTRWCKWHPRDDSWEPESSFQCEQDDLPSWFPSRQILLGRGVQTTAFTKLFDFLKIRYWLTYGILGELESIILKEESDWRYWLTERRVDLIRRCLRKTIDRLDLLLQNHSSRIDHGIMMRQFCEQTWSGCFNGDRKRGGGGFCCIMTGDVTSIKQKRKKEVLISTLMRRLVMSVFERDETSDVNREMRFCLNFMNLVKMSKNNQLWAKLGDRDIMMLTHAGGGGDGDMGLAERGNYELKIINSTDETPTVFSLCAKKMPHRYPRLVLDSLIELKGYDGPAVLWGQRALQVEKIENNTTDSIDPWRGLKAGTIVFSGLVTDTDISIKDRLWIPPWTIFQRNTIDRLLQLGTFYTPQRSVYSCLVPDRLLRRNGMNCLISFKQFLGQRCPQPQWLHRSLVEKNYPYLLVQYRIEELRRQTIGLMPLSVLFTIPRALLGSSSSVSRSQGPLISALKFAQSRFPEAVCIRCVSVDSKYEKIFSESPEMCHLWALVQMSGPALALAEVIVYFFECMHERNIALSSNESSDLSYRQIVCCLFLPKNLRSSLYNSNLDILATLVGHGFYLTKKESDSYFEFSFPEFDELGHRPDPNYHNATTSESPHYKLLVTDQDAQAIGYNFPLLFRSSPLRVGQMLSCVIVDIARRLAAIVMPLVKTLDQDIRIDHHSVMSPQSLTSPASRSSQQPSRSSRLTNSHSGSLLTESDREIVAFLQAYHRGTVRVFNKFQKMFRTQNENNTQTKFDQSEQVVKSHNILMSPPVKNGDSLPTAETYLRQKSHIGQLLDSASVLASLMPNATKCLPCYFRASLQMRRQSRQRTINVANSHTSKLGVSYSEFLTRMWSTRYAPVCPEGQTSCLQDYAKIRTQNLIKGSRFFLSRLEMKSVAPKIIQACLVCFGSPGCFGDAVRVIAPPRTDLYGRVTFRAMTASPSPWVDKQPLWRVQANGEDGDKTESSVMTSDEISEDETRRPVVTKRPESNLRQVAPPAVPPLKKTKELFERRPFEINFKSLPVFQ